LPDFSVFCRAISFICCIYNRGIETLDLRIGVRIPASQPSSFQLFILESNRYTQWGQPTHTHTYQVKLAQIGHNLGHSPTVRKRRFTCWPLPSRWCGRTPPRSSRRPFGSYQPRATVLALQGPDDRVSPCGSRCLANFSHGPRANAGRAQNS